METRYRVRGGGVDAEIGRQAAEALRAAVGRLQGAVAEIMVMLDDEVRSGDNAPAGAEKVQAMTVRIDFLSGGRLIIERDGDAREDWSRIIPRMAERAAVGVRRELERRWERTAM